MSSNYNSVTLGKRTRSTEGSTPSTKNLPTVGDIAYLASPEAVKIAETVSLAKTHYPEIPGINNLTETSAVLGVDFDDVIFIAKNNQVDKKGNSIKEIGDPWTLEEIFGMAAADPTSPFYNETITRNKDVLLQDIIKNTIRDTARDIFKDSNSYDDSDILSIIITAVSASLDDAHRHDPTIAGLGGGGRRKYRKQRGGNWLTDAFNATIGYSMTFIAFSWGVLKYPFTAGAAKLANLRTTQAIVAAWNNPANNWLDRADEYLAQQIPGIPDAVGGAALAGAIKVRDYLSSLDAYDWSLLFLMCVYTYGGTPFLLNGLSWALSYAPGGILPGFFGEGLLAKVIDICLTYKVSEYGFKLLKFIVKKGVNGCIRVYNAGGLIVGAIEDRFAMATEAQIQTAGTAFDAKLEALLAKIRGRGGEPVAAQIPRVVGELTAAANEGASGGEPEVARIGRRQGNITRYLRSARASSTSASSSDNSNGGSNAAGGQGGQGGGRRRTRRRRIHRKSRTTIRKARKSSRRHSVRR